MLNISQRLPGKDSKRDPITLGLTDETPDSVGLGSDFDGILEAPQGLEDVSKYPQLVRHMCCAETSLDLVFGRLRSCGGEGGRAVTSRALQEPTFCGS